MKERSQQQASQAETHLAAVMSLLWRALLGVPAFKKSALLTAQFLKVELEEQLNWRNAKRGRTEDK